MLRADTWQFKQEMIAYQRSRAPCGGFEAGCQRTVQMGGGGTFGAYFRVYCLRRISNQATDLQRLGTLVCPRTFLLGECLGNYL